MQPYAQTIQNNKCPHGFPVGSCPICSGMGSSASSDRNKPRKKGEMSYNECLAQWNRMKALKQANKEASKARFQALFSHSDKKLSHNFKHLQNTFLKPVSNFISSVSKTFNNAKNNIQNIFKNIFQNTVLKPINNVFNFLNSVAEKLSSFLGERKLIKKDKKEKSLKENLLKPLKIVLLLFTRSSNQNDKERE